MSFNENVLALQSLIQTLPHADWAAADRHLRAMWDEHRHLSAQAEELQEQLEAELESLRESLQEIVRRAHKTVVDLDRVPVGALDNPF